MTLVYIPAVPAKTFDRVPFFTLPDGTRYVLGTSCIERTVYVKLDATRFKEEGSGKVFLVMRDDMICFVEVVDPTHARIKFADIMVGERFQHFIDGDVFYIKVDDKHFCHESTADRFAAGQGDNWCFGPVINAQAATIAIPEGVL